MKNTILKSIFALLMGFMTLPMMGHNYLKIYFKDGHTERHFMHLVNNISMSKYDLEGNLHSDYQMQQIVMPDTTYSYYLADIDSMTFRKVDEEKIKRDVETVTTEAEFILQSCQTVEDIKQHIEDIRNIEGVESVTMTESGIIVQIRDWREICYYFPPEFIDEEDIPLSNKKNTKHPKSISKDFHGTSTSESDRPIKVVLANKLHNDVMRIGKQTKMEILNDILNQLGFDSKYLDNVDISFFANDMYEYDHVILFTHGDFNEESGKHWLYTDTEIDKSRLSDYKLDQLNQGNINQDDIDDIGYNSGKNFVYYLAVSDNFINKRSSKIKHKSPSIFFNGACKSLAGHEELERNVEPFIVMGNDNIAKALCKENSFDIYIGYNASNVRGPLGGIDLFMNMLNGQSEEVAFSNIKPRFLHDHWLYVVDTYLTDICYDNDPNNSPRKKFIVETKTKELSPIDILDYSVNGKIRLTGYTTMLDPFLSTVKCGFLYNIDGQNFPVIQCSKEYNMLEIKKDNVSFSATIDLKKGQKLEYQAFTYDGVNYNWGEQRSFIDYDEISLSTNSVSINVGETSTIDITAGSGSYSIEKIEPEGVVTASISENRISIEALTAGTAIITIKDDKSEERATIEVYVTANLALASYTMELTSGETKTVEITSGSGNYTVESDNPNVAQADEKDGLVTIIGRRPSTEPAIITVTDNVSKQTATITVTVMNATDYSTGEAIDLGLPSGTLWASCNIGASSEVEPGSFFAWGETETKQSFYKSNYQYYDSSTDTYKSLGYNISGTQYDAAHFIWGGAWRMPTMADFKELRDNCQTRWTTYKGVICKQYTGPNGNSIYMPAAGYYSGDVLNGKDEAGYYWSADLYPKDERYAYLIVTENSSQNTIYYGGRSLGATIRPVQKSSIPEEERITQVVPEEYLDVLDDHITIYKGNNPPNIEGEYLVEPCTMLYDSEGGFNVGHEFSPKQIKISNQDILNNTVDYEDKQASSVNKGIGSFISGDGDNFSVFFNTEGVSHYTEYDIYSKRAMIVSGTKTAEGIRNLTYAFIITSESDDPQNKHMDVGDYRVIHDGDGLAENYPWDTPKSSKKRSVNESETLLPDSSNDSNATRNSVTEKNNDVQVICIE